MIFLQNLWNVQNPKLLGLGSQNFYRMFPIEYFFKGLFTNDVMHQRGEGGWPKNDFSWQGGEGGLGKKWFFMTRGGGGVRQKMILYDKEGLGSDKSVFPPTKWQFFV